MAKTKVPSDAPKPRQGSADGGAKSPPKAPVRQGSPDGGAKKK